MSEKKTNKIDEWLPLVVLILGTLALGFSSLFVLWAQAPGTVAAFYREAFAVLITGLPIWFLTQKERPYSKKHLFYAALAGIFFVADIAVWNSAVFMTSATNATLFNNTSVLWVGLIAVFFFKEKLTLAFWLGLFTAFIGVLIIVGSDFIKHPKIGLGDFLAMLAALGYAGFFLATQKARVNMGVLSSFLISALAGAIFILPICWLMGYPLLGYSSHTYLNLLGLALFTQVGGYIAINYALGHLPATVVSSVVLLQPLVTALLAKYFLNQPIEINQIVGGFFVLTGIFLVHRSRRQRIPVSQEEK